MRKRWRVKVACEFQNKITTKKDENKTKQQARKRNKTR